MKHIKNDKANQLACRLTYIIGIHIKTWKALSLQVMSDSESDNTCTLTLNTHHKRISLRIGKTNCKPIMDYGVMKCYALLCRLYTRWVIHNYGFQRLRTFVSRMFNVWQTALIPYILKLLFIFLFETWKWSTVRSRPTGTQKWKRKMHDLLELFERTLGVLRWSEL